MIVGWFSLTIGSVLSAALATWVMNGGYTSLYYHFGKHGVLWTLLELPIVFVTTVHILHIMPVLSHYFFTGLYHLLAA